MYYLYKWISNCKTNCTRKIAKVVSIFSRNITAVGNKTFDANCLNACDTPPASLALPIGTFMWCDAGLIGPGDKVLVLR